MFGTVMDTINLSLMDSRSKGCIDGLVLVFYAVIVWIH